MIDPNLKLTVLHDDDSSFTDYSNQMVDYLSNSVVMTVTTTDYIYIGYRKPFNATYIEMQTANINPATMSVEYYDGTSYVDADYFDETNAMTRSGLVSWDKSSMEESTVDGKSAYYVRFKLDSDSSAMEIRGMNIVFSDDRDLKQEFFEIDDPGLLPEGYDSHIPKHVAARNQIIQELRNRGNQKASGTNAVPTDINAWDLHDVFQIREAAMFLALSKIFFNLSDNVDDNWFRKFEEYNGKYKSAMSLYNLNYDENDNGVEEVNEKSNKYRAIRFSR